MKNTQKIWRKNFDIKRVDLNLPVEALPGFGNFNYMAIGKNVITETIWIAENMDNTATYVLKNELREIINLTMQVILENSKKIDALHKKIIETNRKYFEYAAYLRTLDLKKLTDNELLTCHKKLFNFQYLAHCPSLPTTWFLDSDGEDFSKYLMNFLSQRIKKLKLKDSVATVFSILTSPDDTTLSSQEEDASFAILDWIQKTPALKKWFLSSPTEKLKETFETLSKDWQKKMQKHCYRWCWTPYVYLGPAYDLEYYLEVWRGLIRENVNPQEVLKKKKEKAVAIQKQKKNFIKNLQLTEKENHWFSIASDIVWIKGFRKDCCFHGAFVLDLLLAEMGKRSHLSLRQMKHLTPLELPAVLKGRDFSSLANERMKFCVVYFKASKKIFRNWNFKGLQIFVGDKAKSFLKKQKFEKIKIEKKDFVEGSCACPGKVKGVVCIVNVTEEMKKMQEGDIFVSMKTYPAFVPAMKKASAIVTEDGGITCHAAIVARELQTPCVVGCKNATSIFKDGDIIEVDAEKGIVKIIHN